MHTGIFRLQLQASRRNEKKVSWIPSSARTREILRCFGDSLHVSIPCLGRVIGDIYQFASPYCEPSPFFASGLKTLPSFRWFWHY